MNQTPNKSILRAEISAFVRTSFGVRGTLRLHRAAFGADLLRAPLNVVLSPVLVLTRLTGLLAKMIGFRKTADWLSHRKILLETNVSRQVALRVLSFVTHLQSTGHCVDVPVDALEHEVGEYTGVRSAVGEITTTLLVMIAGYHLFQTATPGLLSLAGPVAELRAHALAVEQFPLGQGLGKMYYGVFSTNLGPWQVAATGGVLALIASVISTFAGVIADPLQVMTGTHRRRLSRLITRLERSQGRSSGLAREHVTARLADITDVLLNVWRALRG